MKSWFRSGFAIPLFVGIFTFVVYAACANRGLMFEDSGEFITSAYTLSIAHPPGYPVYVLGGNIASRIMFGEPAYRVHLASALYGAGAAALAYSCLVTLGAGAPVAVIASLVLAFSKDAWSQAMVADVYSLNLFFIMATLRLFLWWAQSKKRTALYSFAFVYGLHLANHGTAVFFLPIFAVWYFVMIRPSRVAMRDMLASVAFALISLAVILYIPMRSVADPVINWNNPQTLSRFITHVSRSQYQPLSVMVSAELIAREMGVYFFDLLPAQFRGVFAPGSGIFKGIGYFVSYAWLVLAGFGFVRLAKNEPWRSRMAGWAIGALGVLASIGFVLVMRFKIQRADIFLSRVMFIPSYGFVCLAAGLGLDMFVKRVRGHWRNVVTGFGIVMLVFVTASNWHYNDERKNRFGTDYIRNMLTVIKPDSLMFTTADEDLFGMWYWQHVLGKRRDIVQLAKECAHPWYLSDLRRKHGVLDSVVKTGLAACNRSRALWAMLLDAARIPKSGRAEMRREVDRGQVPEELFLPLVDLYVENQRRAQGLPKENTGRGRVAILQELIVEDQLPRRPVYFTYSVPELIKSRYKEVPLGMVLEITPRDRQPDLHRQYFFRFTHPERYREKARWDHDYNTRFLMSYYGRAHMFRAQFLENYFKRGRFVIAEARARYEEIEKSPYYKPFQVEPGLGYIDSRVALCSLGMDDPQDALKYIRKAISINRKDLEKAMARLGKDANLLEQYTDSRLGSVAFNMLQNASKGRNGSYLELLNIVRQMSRRPKNTPEAMDAARRIRELCRSVSFAIFDWSNVPSVLSQASHFLTKTNYGPPARWLEMARAYRRFSMENPAYRKLIYQVEQSEKRWRQSAQ